MCALIVGRLNNGPELFVGSTPPSSSFCRDLSVRMDVLAAAVFIYNSK